MKITCDRVQRPKGFALVVTLSLMILLTIVAVGLLSLSSVALRSSSQGEALRQAQANARMALLVALGELQKNAGPDQAITATASVLAEAGQVAEPHWTGVWSTDPAKPDAPVWLVSGGSSIDPKAGVAGDADSRHSMIRTTLAERQVEVAKVAVPGSGATQGRIAWWVGDEGVKARVDVQAPPKPSIAPKRRTLIQTPQEPGIMNMHPDLASLRPGGTIPRSSLITVATTGAAVNIPDLPERFIHDLTTIGQGLPVNVRDGGFKTDLSILFDAGAADSAAGKARFKRYFGAEPKRKTLGSGAKTFEFDISAPEKFYLVDSQKATGVGPNWGNLFSYHRLWENLAAGRTHTEIVGAVPNPETDLRTNTWAPYTRHDQGQYRRDVQHVNSSISPVVSMLQIGFRLKTVPVPAEAGGGGTRYMVRIEFKPVVGLWNPYNVQISPTKYIFDWALYPYFRFGYAKPGEFNQFTELWMREHWNNAEGGKPPEEQRLNRWFRMDTTEIDLQPGEFRLFSVTTADSIPPQSSAIRLASGWKEQGAFIFDAIDSKTGQKVILPEDHILWVGDLFLEDLQHPETQKRFNSIGGGISKESSVSWFTLKTGAGNVANDLFLTRINDIWFPGTTPSSLASVSSRVVIPEQIVSGASPSLPAYTYTTKPKFPVTELVNNPYQIGTWVFYARTTTQAPDGQGIAGFADTNLRAIASNPLWDGTNFTAAPNRGTYFISPFIGGEHGQRDPASRGVIGDGGPWPGRGLIAEGDFGDATPQSPGGSRYQGYGGSSIGTAGQTHVIVFDVPRSPAVSVGQLQNAQLSRYNFDPTFVLGNSYANPRIISTATARTGDYNTVKGFRPVDISYFVNRSVWDGYYYSTLGQDYIKSTAASSNLDSVFDFAKLAGGEQELPNPRHSLHPLPGDVSFAGIEADADGDVFPEALSARIRINGAFNVNSTSVSAWKALLSSMQGFDYQVLKLPGSSGGTPTVSWESDSPIRLPRFGHVLQAGGYRKGGDGADPEFWQGARQIDTDELQQLAEEIVKEVRARGPFKSFADFVNRDPSASEEAMRMKGALQAALDRTLNASLPLSVGKPTDFPKVTGFPSAGRTGSQATGHAAHVQQGDMLQALAPVMQVRSDSFRIRAVGEAHDTGGRLLARAVCEAFVQRGAAYVDSADKPEVKPSALTREANRRFGRRFEVISFRWLADTEV